MYIILLSPSSMSPRNCLFKWCSTRFWSRRYRSDLKVPSIPTVYIDNAVMYYILSKPVVDPVTLQASVMNYFYRPLPAHQCERTTRLGTLIACIIDYFSLQTRSVTHRGPKSKNNEGWLGDSFMGYCGIIDDATLNRSPCLCSM